MALETGTYISDLVVTNPLGGDPKSDGDGHLRLLKSTIKATFPNVNGEVDRTPAQLNKAGVEASETVTGIAEIATQAETDAGTDDARIVTPLKLRNGFAISISTISYIAFPSWLGGWIFQFGTGGTTSGSAAITWPLAFPNSCRAAIGGVINDTGGATSGVAIMQVGGLGVAAKTSCNFYARNPNDGTKGGSFGFVFFAAGN